LATKEQKEEELNLYLNSGVCSIDNIKITHNLKSEVSELAEDDAYELDL
jgi:hypothetical protein